MWKTIKYILVIAFIVSYVSLPLILAVLGDKIELDKGYRGPYCSYSIEESKGKGVFLWEYETDSIIRFGTDSIHIDYAFVEKEFYHPEFKNDSIATVENRWHFFFKIPECKPYPETRFEIAFEKYPGQLYPGYMPGEGYFIRELVDSITPRDTLRFHIVHNYRRVDNVGIRDTTTWFYLIKK